MMIYITKKMTKMSFFPEMYNCLSTERLYFVFQLSSS